MYACMYCVCIYVCAYIYVYMHVCIYICKKITMHVCIHVCIYVIFKLGFERYGGIVLVGRGNSPGNCLGGIVRGNYPGGKCPGPSRKSISTHVGLLSCLQRGARTFLPWTIPLRTLP